jgi:peptide/nickel transport system permease protein
MSAVSASSVRRRSVRRLAVSDPVLVVAAVIAALIVCAAILAPLLAPYDYTQTRILDASQGPSASHLLGTDALGRDILSKLLYGARLSLVGPGVVALAALVLGTSVAIGAVWIGGRLDSVISRALDILFAFPSLLIAILAVSIFGEGLAAPIVALSIAYTPYIARVVRAIALRERNLPYIDSCRMMGYSGLRICRRHILPNVRGVVAAQATVAFASALVDLAALSFIGLGTQPPTVDWGTMVNDGSSELVNGYAQQCLAAGGAIVVTVVAFNVLGERLSTRAARTVK